MPTPQILQLYRSTNIWLTRNMAKAAVETNAKDLQSRSVKDGEPILARFYDKSNGYTFSYTAITGNTDPYTSANSADHVWTEDFDSFATLPTTVDYDSAAYIRVGTSPSWTYYQLNAVPTSSPSTSDTVGISSIFGVAFVSSSKTYIEWFDSEANAKSVMTSCNYSDSALKTSATFVNGVHESNGKILPMHGTLVGGNGVNIVQSTFSWETINEIDVPIDYTWDSSNTFTTIPSALSNSPLFIRVGTGSYTYYALKNDGVSIGLDINDINNVLATNGTGNGLQANLNLRALSSAEITALSDSNVREAYKLVGNASGSEVQIGSVIKIYKDQTLYSVYLGHVDDTITSTTNPTVIPGTGDTALCFIYILSDGTYSLVTVNISNFLEENEFSDGLEVNNHVVQAKLSSTGGIEFDSTVLTGNKPLKIKLDNSEQYYEFDSNGTSDYDLVNMFEYTDGNGNFCYVNDSELADNLTIYTNAANPDEYESTNATTSSSVAGDYFIDANISFSYNSTTWTPTNTVYRGFVLNTGNGDYKLSTFLETSSNGLTIVSSKITELALSAIQNHIRINDKTFVGITDEILNVDLSGSDINVTGSNTQLPTINDLDRMPTSGDAVGYYYYQGSVYKWDGSTSILWELSSQPATTKVSDVLAIYEKLISNLDMGTYTI